MGLRLHIHPTVASWCVCCRGFRDLTPKYSWGEGFKRLAPGKIPAASVFRLDLWPQLLGKLPFKTAPGGSATDNGPQ